MSIERFSGWRALVTGASAGIGQEMARLLAAARVNLVLTARREERLAALRDELTAAHGVEVTVVPADLAAPEGPSRLVDAVVARDLEIDLLINNAGLGGPGFVAQSEWAQLRTVLQVNVVALTELTTRLLPGMLERGRGHVINVGSLAGYTPIPRMATYAASKAFVHSFSQALDDELRFTPVGVTVVHPGGTRSEFVEKNGMKVDAKVDRAMMDAIDVARIGLEGAARGRRVVVTGLINRLFVATMAVSPRRLVMRTLDRTYRGLSDGPPRLGS